MTSEKLLTDYIIFGKNVIGMKVI